MEVEGGLVGKREERLRGKYRLEKEMEGQMNGIRKVLNSYEIKRSMMESDT
jgi:hypothetical protein